MISRGYWAPRRSCAALLQNHEIIIRDHQYCTQPITYLHCRYCILWCFCCAQTYEKNVRKPDVNFLLSKYVNPDLGIIGQLVGSSSMIPYHPTFNDSIVSSYKPWCYVPRRHTRGHWTRCRRATLLYIHFVRWWSTILESSLDPSIWSLL